MGNQKIKIELLVHDLKGPLAVIETGITSLLQRENKYGSLSEKQKKVLHRALRNTKITQTLVNDTLEVGRSTEGIINKNIFPISGLITQSLVEIFDLMEPEIAEKIGAADNLSDMKSILAASGIIFNVDDSLWDEELFLDGRKVKQIFRNLLGNAMKYRDKLVTVDVVKDEGYFSLSITDDGCGIEQEYQELVFEKYFQLFLLESKNQNLFYKNNHFL